MNERPTYPTRRVSADNPPYEPQHLPAQYAQLDDMMILEIFEWVRGGTRNPDVALSKTQMKNIANQLFTKNLSLEKRSKELVKFCEKYAETMGKLVDALAAIARLDAAAPIGTSRDIALGALAQGLLQEYNSEVRNLIANRIKEG